LSRLQTGLGSGCAGGGSCAFVFHAIFPAVARKQDQTSSGKHLKLYFPAHTNI
jgi:hypothetical protein